MYDDIEEFALRLERFTHNNRLIIEHNAKKANFKLGHNPLTDWTKAEYEAILGYIPPLDYENDNRNF